MAYWTLDINWTWTFIYLSLLQIGPKFEILDLDLIIDFEPCTLIAHWTWIGLRMDFYEFKWDFYY